MTTARSLFVGAGLALAALMPLAAGAQVSSPQADRANRDATPGQRDTGNDCVLSKASFRTEKVEISTSAIDFVNIPDTSVTFTQTAKGCVIIRFSAETYSRNNVGIDVRARLDDRRIAQPGQVFWTSDEDEDRDGRGYSVKSFDFVIPNVDPGSHTIAMQWRSTSSNAAGFMFFRTLVIQHQ